MTATEEEYKELYDELSKIINAFNSSNDPVPSLDVSLQICIWKILCEIRDSLSEINFRGEHG